VGVSINVTAGVNHPHHWRFPTSLAFSPRVLSYSPDFRSIWQLWQPKDGKKVNDKQHFH
jgi:hypothetical protein